MQTINFCKKISIKYFESNAQYLDMVEFYKGSHIQQVSALVILHATKFMPKSLACKFTFKKQPSNLFGFELVYATNPPFDNKDVQGAIKQAISEIKPYLREIKLLAFISIINNTIKDVRQSEGVFSSEDGVFLILNALKKDINSAVGTIESPISKLEKAIVNLTSFDDVGISDIGENFIPEIITSKELLDNKSKPIKALVSQLCIVACADSVKEGLLTTTLHSNIADHSSTIASKRLVTITPALLLTAMLGTPQLLEYAANLFGLNKNDMEFSQDIREYRDELMEYISTKTFESNENSVRKETYWIAKAEECKSLIKLSKECEYFLGALCNKNTNKVREQLQHITSSENWRYIGQQLTDFTKSNMLTPKSNVQKYSIARSIKHYLNNQVLGQHQAVEAISSTLSSMLLNKPKQHLGVATFIGTGGVGKTFLAEKLAESLNLYMSLGFKCKIINCEQYTDERDVLKLWGSGSQYVNSEMGELTMKVTKHPRHIIVFDEIEKAHPAVVQSLLTLIDKGTGKDRTSEKEVDFSSCLFIFTTNLGHKTIEQFNNSDVEIDLTDLLSNANDRNALSSEMVNRLNAGDIVLFNKLKSKDYIKLATTASDRFLEGNAIDWKGLLPELIIDTLGGNISPRSINTQADKLQGAIMSKVMNTLPEEQLFKLNNITVSKGE